MVDERLPRAVEEALEESDDRQASEVVGEVARLLGPTAAAPALGARLIESVSRAPLRYAPFFTRLGELFDLEEGAVERIMARLEDPKCWRRTGLRGVSRVEVAPGPRLAQASTALVRFAPGAHFPAHRHRGFEQVFVMEGSYTDDEGVVHGPGNLHEMHEDSEHEFWAAKDGPCIAASVLHHGLSFTRWPSKFFNLFMKR